MRDVHIGTAVGTVGLMGHSLPEIVTCQPNTPLSEVLKMFVEKRKHRIYVTVRGAGGKGLPRAREGSRFSTPTDC